ncbi:MAG: histidine kinase [Tessaracoccus sp.]
MAVPPPWSWLIGWALLVLVAACAGLSVLHTRLRDLGVSPRSGWDWCYWPRHQKIAVVAWVVFSLAATGVAGFFAPRMLCSRRIERSPRRFVGPSRAARRHQGHRQLPVSTLRIAVAAVVAVAFSLTALWAVPAGDDEMLHLRFATFWAGFLAIFFVSFGSMFVNVIATTRALERARTDEARLAVAEERVRFARDLHDVFGRTLSAVALKSELAAAQAGADVPRPRPPCEGAGHRH